MADFIACIALFALFLLGLYYERKNKKRDEHEEWLYSCRQCLLRITRSFRRDCQALAEEAFAKYSNTLLQKRYCYTPDYMTYSFLSDYRKSIDALKEDYTDNVIKKFNEAMGCTTITSIPNYLIEEYYKQLSDIYYSFCDLGYLMRKQIAEAKENK